MIPCSMAWLYPDDDLEVDVETRMINYWALRCLPLIERSKNGKPIVFIVANRIGVENETRFGGTRYLYALTS